MILVRAADLHGGVVQPERRFIAVSSLDRKICGLLGISPLLVAVLAGHADGVTQASFGPDGRTLLSASNDGSARIWDPGTEDLLELVGKRNGGPIRRAGSARTADSPCRQVPTGLLASWMSRASGSSEYWVTTRPVNDAVQPGREAAGSLRVKMRRRESGGSTARFAGCCADTGAACGGGSSVAMEREWRPRAPTVRCGSGGPVTDSCSTCSRVTRMRSSTSRSAERASSSSRARGATTTLRGSGPLTATGCSTSSATADRVDRDVVPRPDTASCRSTASGDELRRLWDVRRASSSSTARSRRCRHGCRRFSPDGKRVVTASEDRDARIGASRPVGRSSCSAATSGARRLPRSARTGAGRDDRTKSRRACGMRARVARRADRPHSGSLHPWSRPSGPLTALPSFSSRWS